MFKTSVLNKSASCFFVFMQTERTTVENLHKPQDIVAPAAHMQTQKEVREERLLHISGEDTT